MTGRIPALLLAALLSGCASHIQVSVGNGSLGLQTGTNRGAMIAIGILAIAAHAESYEGGVHYRGNPLVAIQPDSPRPVPSMDESRRVNEQDCSKPIEDGSANLRCR